MQLWVSQHDPHQGICLVKVVPPVRSDGLLAADVPHVQLKPIVHQGLDVEPLCKGNSGHIIDRPLTIHDYTLDCTWVGIM